MFKRLIRPTLTLAMYALKVRVARSRGLRTVIALPIIAVCIPGALSTGLAGQGMVQSSTPAQPQSVERVTSAEGITEYRLPNGLRVLLFPDQSKQIITVNITYLVGSRHENYGETGMAHLLEHLVFKGTPRRADVPKELNDHGARWNGTTWFERTNYFETFPATEENLKWALDFEADRMVNSFISKKDLDSEFSVVRNDMEMHENNHFDTLHLAQLR